jgi:arylsulfatase A
MAMKDSILTACFRYGTIFESWATFRRCSAVQKSRFATRPFSRWFTSHLRLYASVLSLALSLVCGHAWAATSASEAHPNIVFILADDMGYGDPHCFNPNSKVPTPQLDRLAAEGIRFTDAHAAGPLCVPSRYGVITGCYPMRAASLVPKKGALIESGQVTIASFLRDHGYATGMVGKWHLGFNGGVPFDCSRPLRGGPVDHGFDYFFGQHASLDIPPYFFIENDHCVAAPTDYIHANHSPDWTPIQGAFWRAGGIAPGFKMADVLPTYTRKAVEYIEHHGHDKKPFFLYAALTAPHTPWLPADKFRGRSGASLYGDFVAMTDDAVGQILGAIERAGLREKTLLFFSSDNGPVWFPRDVQKYGHSAAGIFRGMKGDSWEGGHREPFIVRWPGRIRPGSTSKQTICFTDLFATFAAVIGAEVPSGVARDSVSFLPALLGRKHYAHHREWLVMGWDKGNLAIRKGDWKLIPFLGSGGFTRPSHIKPKPGEPIGQLYNLAADPGETKNLYANRPMIVKELTSELDQLWDNRRSR